MEMVRQQSIQHILLLTRRAVRLLDLLLRKITHPSKVGTTTQIRTVKNGTLEVHAKQIATR
jgi:hypothetical protein